MTAQELRDKMDELEAQINHELWLLVHTESGGTLGVLVPFGGGVTSATIYGGLTTVFALVVAHANVAAQYAVVAAEENLEGTFGPLARQLNETIQNIAERLEKLEKTTGTTGVGVAKLAPLVKPAPKKPQPVFQPGRR